MSIKLGDLKSWGEAWPDPSMCSFPDEGIDVYDSIHGYVKMEREEVFLLDLPPVQRLRCIRQLGLANLVYPGANHTRLEHSIGVFCLVKKIIQTFKQKPIPEIKIDDDTSRDVAFAALLHDIGHFPFSHTTEILVSENFEGKNHEALGSDIVNTPYMKSAFDRINDESETDIDIKAVSDFIVGKAKGDELYLANLIKGLIDADRMDYLVRDAHHTGVPFGRVDLERLEKTLTPFRDRDSWILAVEEKGRSAVESLIVGRSLMHNSVYYHHTKRISEAMLARATYSTFDEQEPLLNLLLLDDDLLFARLLSSNGYSKSIARRLLCRDLFTRVLTLRVSDIGNRLALSDFTDPTKVPLHEKIKREQAICQELGIDDGQVILDFPEIPKTKEIDFPVVLDKNRIKPLSELSLIAIAAEGQRRKDWTAYVFCSQKDPKTEKKIKSYLNENVGLSLG